MGKKEQIPALAIFVQGSLWVWSATSRRVVLPMGDGGLALAVFHTWIMVPRQPIQKLFKSQLVSYFRPFLESVLPKDTRHACRVMGR